MRLVDQYFNGVNVMVKVCENCLKTWGCRQCGVKNQRGAWSRETGYVISESHQDKQEEGLDKTIAWNTLWGGAPVVISLNISKLPRICSMSQRLGERSNSKADSSGLSRLTRVLPGLFSLFPFHNTLPSLPQISLFWCSKPYRGLPFYLE